MKKLNLFSFAAAALVGLADTTTSGVLEIASQEDLSAAGAITANGAGTIRYTGAGHVATDADLTLNPGAAALVSVSVTDPDGEIEFRGAVNQTSGQFVKRGPGTLTVSSPSDAKLGYQSNGAVPENVVPVYDETTGLNTTGGYKRFAMDDGTLRINMPGKTFNIPNDPWIGTRFSGSPVLDIVAGAVWTDGWTTLSRGTGSSTDIQHPTIRIHEGGSLRVGSFNSGYVNGNPDFHGRSRIEVDGGTMTMAGEVYMNEQHGDTAVTVRNGGLFQSTKIDSRDSGIYMPRDSGSVFTMDVSGAGSTAAAHSMYLRKGSSVAVRDGGALRVSHTIPSRYGLGNENGSVSFDGGLLAGYYNSWKDTVNNPAGLANIWLDGCTLEVGAGGLAVDVAKRAWLCPVPQAAADGASMTKTGDGTLEMGVPGLGMPLEVAAGSVRSTRAVTTWTNGLTQVIAPARDGDFVLGGDGGLGAATVRPADGVRTRFETTVGGLTAGEWSMCGWARILPDGTALLSDGGPTMAGAVWKKTKVDVSRSFTLSYQYFGENLMKNDVPYAGLMAVWQNSAAGTAALGSAPAAYDTLNLGYVGIGDSYGIGFELRGNHLVGSAGAQEDRPAIGYANATAAREALLAGEAARLKVTLAYDAEAKTLTQKLFSPVDGQTRTLVRTGVDLAARTGGDEAYFGFTAGSHVDRQAVQYVSDVVLDYGGEKPVRVQVNGTAELAAGSAWRPAVARSAAQNGVVMSKLVYGDGAVLDVDAEDTTRPEGVHEPVLTDPSLWTLSGGAQWKTGTSIACASRVDGQNRKGGFRTAEALPVTDSWEISFDYETGNDGARHADYFRFNLANDDGVIQEWNTWRGLMVYVALYHDKCSYEEDYNELCVWSQSQDWRRAEGEETQYLRLPHVNLSREGKAHFTFTYDAPAKRLTIAVSQRDGALADRYVYPNVDLAGLFPSGRAHAMFFAQVGGLWTESIVSEFRMASDTLASLVPSDVAGVSLGFDAVEGSGTLVKRGAGDLLLTDAGNASASLRMEEGSLTLGKASLATVHADARHGGWTHSDRFGGWGPHGGLKFGSDVQNNRNSATTFGRTYVAGAWKASFAIDLVGQTWPADALSFFLTNSEDGRQVLGGSNMAAGYDGRNSFGLAWAYYPGSGYRDRVSVSGANGGGFDFGADGRYAYFGDALKLPDAVTRVEIVHDPAAKTVALRMEQGDAVFTHVFENVDLPARLGGDYAHLGFSTGGGGAHTIPEIRDFAFTQMSAADPRAETPYLAKVELAGAATPVLLESPVAGGVFRMAEEVEVADGAKLSVRATDRAAVLAVPRLKTSAAELAVEAEGAALSVASVAGAAEGTAFVKTGAGDLALASLEGVASVTVEAGVLELPDGVDSKTCAIVLAEGAKLRVGGRVRVHSVTCAGELQKGGAHRVGGADAWLEGVEGGSVVPYRPMSGLTFTIR